MSSKLRAIPIPTQRRSRQAASTPARARLFARVCRASDEGRSGSGYAARRTLRRTSAFPTASPIDSRRAHCEATRCSTPRVGSHHPSSGVSLEPGRAARDDPAKMSTNSFHASAGARLESSTPRMDNPFTSGEEEVRRDGARREPRRDPARDPRRVLVRDARTRRSFARKIRRGASKAHREEGIDGA